MSKILGFLGVESYDLVYYLGSVMHALGKSVLAVDYSPLGELASIVPYGLSNGEVVEQYGVNIAKNVELDDVLESEDYDYVILYFSSFIKHDNVVDCDEVYLVTDFQKHNINNFLNLDLDDEQCRFLVYRNRIETKIDLMYVINALKGLEITEEETYVMEDAQDDYDAMVMLQYDSIVNGLRISADVSNFIIDVLNVDFTEKLISNAIKQLNRRK